ncbi:MAG: MOSC domain-containing protein [Methylovirgula sp.]
MSENEAFLSRILIFPIKSLVAVEIAQARMLSSGALEHDRTWGLFDAGSKFVNGKRHAAVHRLRARVDLGASTVTLRDENGRGLGDRTFSLDQDGDLLERWLAEYFGFPVSFRKNMALGFPDDTASPGPTIISVATLAEIGRWFDLPIEEVRLRFRREDHLFGPAGTVVRFRIGEAVLEGVNPCQRCIVPPRNPWTGALDDTFVRRFTELRVRTLPSWATRERFNHFYRVAINTRPHGEQGGRSLHVGDRIEILDSVCA